MKIKKMSVRFLTAYFYGVAFAAIALVLLEWILELKAEFIITILESTVVSQIPSALFIVVLLQEGLDAFELWMRRIICMIFSTTCIGLSFYAFGVLTSKTDIIHAFISCFIGMLLIGIPLFIIADRRNKKKLEAINEKLKENKE